MKRRHALALLAAMSVFTAAHAQDRQKLRIAVEGAYPPFSEVGADGKLKGFDIDIANALCEQMKVECVLIQQNFDGMIPALNARKFDAIVASMSITPERLQSVAFTKRYYKTPARLVTKAGAPFPTTPEGLKGKRIGVQRATINDRYVTDQFKGAEIVRYGKQDEVYLDLAAGRIDATLVDSVAADVGFLQTPQGKAFGFTGPEYTDPVYFGIGAGIALRKSDTERINQLNAAIDAIRKNGVYKKIQDRYFKFDVYGSDKS